MAGLVVGTVVALSITQDLRREGPVARAIKFEPSRDGTGRTVISFRLAKPDTADVDVVDSEGRLVRELASEARLEGGDRKHVYYWDRQDDNGAPAPPGRYRLRLMLRDADRVATSGERYSIKPPDRTS